MLSSSARAMVTSAGTFSELIVLSAVLDAHDLTWPGVVPAKKVFTWEFMVFDSFTHVPSLRFTMMFRALLVI